jgi:hypothetical protein
VDVTLEGWICSGTKGVLGAMVPVFALFRGCLLLLLFMKIPMMLLNEANRFFVLKEYVFDNLLLLLPSQQPKYGSRRPSCGVVVL